MATSDSNQTIDARTLRTPNVLTTYEAYAEGLPPVAEASLSTGMEGAAIAHAKRVLRDISPDSGLKYTSGYEKGDMTYAYVQQTHNDIPIAFAVANIAWKNDRVVAFGHSFHKSDSVASNIPAIGITAAIPLAEQHAVGTHNGHPPTLEYLMKPDGHLALVHVIQVQNDDAGTWHEVLIDAHSGDLLFLNDFVSHSTYTVLPVPGDAMPANGFETLTDPADTTASPSGWHTVSTVSTTTTAGNNCIAYKGDDDSSTTKQSSATLNFNYAFDASKEPTDTTNLDAARVNAFYIANKFHDFTYRYGFTEDAFNFQQYNFDRGGKEGDRVEIRVQADPDKRNNANFKSPADGQSGICSLFLFDMTTPERDSAFDNGIIIHELTHGLTHRMIGGGTASSLMTAEARGLGEGWSDAMADWVSQTSAPIKDRLCAVYASGKPKGLRTYPYSTSRDTNPLKYSDVEKYVKEGKVNVHKIGQIWANILHNIHAALVEKYGFSTSAMTNPDGTEGNIMFLHLFIDSLALLAADPTFLLARQAWLQADTNRYNGANQVLLWKVFASRGLGVGAKDYVDSTLMPSHSKPIIVERLLELPPLPFGVPGHILSVSLNPQTIITISGIVTADWKQKVKAELLDTLSLKSQAIEFFDGQGRKSLVVESTSQKALTWGPFDNQMTVELTFYHMEQEGNVWLPTSTIKGDKMLEFLAYDLQTAISVIPIDDGGHGFQDYQNTTLTVNRMTLF